MTPFLILSDVEQQATISLASIEELQTLSRNVISSATELKSSLKELQQESSLAKLAATEASQMTSRQKQVRSAVLWRVVYI